MVQRDSVNFIPLIFKFLAEEQFLACYTRIFQALILVSLLVETPSTGTFFKFIKFLQAPDFKAVSDVATFY